MGKIRPSLRLWLATPTRKGNYNRAGASDRSGDGIATQLGGSPNPEWLEWFMGFPRAWTDSAASGTPSSQRKLDSPGNS